MQRADRTVIDPELPDLGGDGRRGGISTFSPPAVPAISMQHKPLFSNSNYQIDYFSHERPSRFLVITFTEYGNNRLDGFGFGGDFLLRQNFDVIAVKCDSDIWYQDFPDDAVAAMREILALPYVHRGSYGSSMGGFAAIYFTQTFALDTALAISPQYDITMERETRWPVAASRIVKMQVFNHSNVLNDQCRYVIVFDPKQQAEMLQIEPFRRNIPDERRVDILAPFSGHPSGYLLSRMGILKTLVTNSLSGEPVPQIQEKYRSNKSTQDGYLFSLSLKCIKQRKYTWARALLERCINYDLLHPEYNIQLAIVYEHLNMLDKAVAHAAIAASVNINHSNMVFHLARLLECKGKNTEAAFFAHQVLQVEPTFMSAAEILSRMTNGSAND